MQRLGLSARNRGYRNLVHSLTGSPVRFSSFSGHDHDDFWTAAKTAQAQTTPANQQAAAPSINDGDQWATPGGYGPGRMPMGQAYGPPPTSSDGNRGPYDTQDASNKADSFEYVPPPPTFDMQSPKHLSPIKQIDVRSFKGQTLVDIRQYFRGDDGIAMPSKKGIALTIPQWRRLQQAMSDIDIKLREMEQSADQTDLHEGGEQGPGGRAP